MKLKVNSSKNAIIAIFGIFALFNHAFASKQEWFKADFLGFYLGSTFDVGWEAKDVMVEDVSNAESHFQDSKLYLEGDEVRLKIPSGRSAEGNNLLLTISTTVQCDGFDELPEPPLKKDGYLVAVAPMFDGNYYILGYDEAGGTNRWFDSGIAAVSDRPTDVNVYFAYTNCENIAIYEFDGKRTEQVEVWGSHITQCEFAGCGVISRCTGYDEEVAPMIPLELPQIDGVRSRIDRKKDFGYPEEFLTVYFDLDTMIPSRASARFWVAPDGSMVFADEGEYPHGIEIVATRNGVPYASFEEALDGADNYDLIRLESDVQFFQSLEVNRVMLDLNGHYLDPDPSGCSTLTINTASVYDYLDDTQVGAIHATIKLNVSLDLSWQDIYFFDVNLCKPDVVLTIRYPIPFYYSGISGYEVVEEAMDNGCFRYSLVRLPTIGVVKGEKTDERAELLGCSEEDVDEELAKFRIESIRQESGKWVVTVTGGRRHGDRYGNGYVRIYKVDACGNPTDDPEARLFRAGIVPNPPSD